jgi:hypothetical protein
LGFQAQQVAPVQEEIDRSLASSSMPSLFPGSLEAELQHQFLDFVQQRTVERLFAGDSTRWPEELTTRDPALAKLDWRLLPKRLAHFLNMLQESLRVADPEGFIDHALLT